MLSNLTKRRQKSILPPVIMVIVTLPCHDHDDKNSILITKLSFIEYDIGVFVIKRNSLARNTYELPYPTMGTSSWVVINIRGSNAVDKTHVRIQNCCGVLSSRELQSGKLYVTYFAKKWDQVITYTFRNKFYFYC